LSQPIAIPRLLIVEDDPAVRTALERVFRSVGIVACFAATVSEGLAKLHECDVALIDLALPDGLGTDLLRAIRLGSMPIRAAIYSGNEDAELIVGASGERPDAMFKKPTDFARLRAWVVGPAQRSA
jgi:DNA-binding response OmpR family regulator